MSPFEEELARRAFLRKLGLGAAGGLALPAALAACGNDDAAVPAGDPTPESVGAAPTVAAEATAVPTPEPVPVGPAAGGQLTLATGDGMGRDLTAGNSFGPGSLANRQHVWSLFKPGRDGGGIQPALASSYDVSADGLMHTIGIKEGLLFHDGSPISSQDVKDNLDAHFFADHPLRDSGIYLMIILFWGFPSVVSEVTVVDEQTVAIAVNEPRADLRGGLGPIYMYNPRVLESALDTYGTDPGALADVGSGPFRVTDFRPGEFVEYERFDGFFEEAFVDQLRIQLIPDAAARFLALEGGEVDASYALSKADWDAGITDDRFRAHVGQTDTNVFLSLNIGVSEPLQDIRVRRAVAMALNRPGYIDAFWGEGMAELGTQVALTPIYPGNNPDIEPIPYDPDGARALLAEAGFPDGFAMSAINPAAFASVPELKTMLEAMAGDLAEVGIDLTINITDVPGWLAGSGANDVSVSPYGNSPGVEVSVASLYLNRSDRQYKVPTLPQYAELIGEARLATDLETVNTNMRELMTLSAEDIAGIPIAYAAPGVLSRAAVHDIDMSASAIAPQNQAWIEQ